MRFGLLGPLAVWTSEGKPVRVPEVKVRALLADLLLHEGRAVSAERLLDDLWGERLPGNPGNTLQTKVSQLRRALEAGEPGARHSVAHRPPGYALLAEPGAVDVQRFRALTAQARDAPGPRERAALLADALALWRGPALADFADEPFAAGAVRRLEEERLAAVEEHADARLALGEHAALTAELADLVVRHPLRERLRGLQMRALYRAGRQSAALDGFAQLRALLVDELGLEPGPELTALQRAIRAQDSALDGPPAPPTVRTNIAPQLTELVGRHDDVREVRARLGAARLVTLTGPGGVGKTRLAIETARRLADAADGVSGGAWLVELAGIEQHVCPESECPAAVWVVEVVAAALGVRDSPAGPVPSGAQADLVERVGDALRAEEVLLVLDNCEQVADPVADLVQRLLRAAPRLRVLATSREPLGVPGEVLWHVQPLALPAPADTLPAVREASAVRLFAARAAAAAPGFVLDEHTAPAVAAICRRLDGIPLALELAAGRVRALGVHELLARLDDRFRVIAGGPRGAPARQRTLRATIDWSWELLTPAERTVLRRLAVHAEGCSLAAAESVCAGEGVRPDEVLDLLVRLVDRSLVVSQGPTSAEPRFRLLETVAAYCLERLADVGEVEQVRQRHIHHYLALAERAEPELRGPEQRQWLEQLDAESANLRAAFEHVVQHADGAEPALRLAGALTWYWFLRGRFGEATRSLRRALAVPGTAPPVARAHAAAWLAGLRVLEGDGPERTELDPPVIEGEPTATARMRWFVGYTLATVGDMAAAERLTRAALATFEAIGDRWGIAAGLVDRASQAMATGHLDAAERYATRSAELFAEVGDRWGQTQSTFALGALAEIAGDYPRAERHHRRGLQMAEELGLWGEVSYQLSWLGRVALLTGSLGEADELHERARRMAVEHGFAPGRIYAVTGLALGARRAGRLDAAEEHLDVALEWGRGVDFEPANSLILAELGFVAELRGDAALATRRQLDGYAIAGRFGDPRAVALALEGLAGAVALGGAPEHAARLLGAAAAARAGVGRPLPPAERGDVDRITAAACRALGEAGFAAEFARGTAAPPDELVSELASSPSDTAAPRTRPTSVSEEVS